MSVTYRFEKDTWSFLHYCIDQSSQITKLESEKKDTTKKQSKGLGYAEGLRTRVFNTIHHVWSEETPFLILLGFALISLMNILLAYISLKYTPCCKQQQISINVIFQTSVVHELHRKHFILMSNFSSFYL